MSLSKYESTQETTNFARVARIILGPCTDVLRAVLAKEITPLNLIKHFNACISQNKKTVRKSRAGTADIWWKLLRIRHYITLRFVS